MSERLATARNGASTAYFGNVALHSAYDPATEADRYVASLKISDDRRLLILVEPCLGYLTSAIRRRFPLIRIVAVHCSSFFSPPILVSNADAEWTPSDRTDCESFLADHVEDWEAASAQVIEWRPAIMAYGEAARDTFRKISTFLKRAAANERTVHAFGRRWLRNAIRNAAGAECAITLVSGDSPIVVTGAGPGLEAQADEIARAKETFPCAVIAVSSAVSALLFRGVVPDLVVASDGGGWAAFHLFETARFRLPVAASLVAQLPSALASRPVLAVADGSAWQHVLLSSNHLPFLTAPQRGTVTATAIDLALAATVGRVYVAGMDLTNSDIRTHARPYALDRFREDTASRFKPEYSSAFERSDAIRHSSTFDIYAAWFAGRADRYAQRLISLGSTHPALTAIRRGNRIDAGGGHKPRTKIVHPEIRLEPRRRYAAAVNAILRALDAEGGEGPLERELTTLLVGGTVTQRRKAARDAVMDATAGLA